MRTWARWTARAAMFSASFVAAGAGTVTLAFAGTTPSTPAAAISGTAGGGWQTSGNHSILGGNQIKVPIDIPVNLCGNAIALLGDAFSGCAGGAHVGGHHHHHGGQHWHTSGNHSILGGNQIKVPVKVPINACGNSVGVLGLAASGCKGGAGAAGGGGWQTSGDNSIVGGNQAKVPVKVPVNACGNALALLGDAFAGCKGGAHVRSGHHGEHWQTSGNNSIGGGNQVKVPVKVPVNVCGNSGAGLGLAASGCKGGAGAAGGGGWQTSGDNSIVGGNQAKVPVKVPVNACGNALSLLGDSFAVCKGGAHVGGGHRGQTWHTSGDNSIGGGNQVKVPVKVPVNVCGNSGSVLGLAASGCKGGAGAAGGGSGWLTSGNNSILGGNQIAVPVKIPINACGNALALLGDAFSGCKGGAHVGRGGHRGQSWHTSGDNSIGGGNQVKVPVKVPANICGNSASVLGDAFSGCKGGATVDGRSASAPHVSNVQLSHMSAPVSSLPLAGQSIIQQPGGALAGLSSLPVLSNLSSQAAQLTSYSTANTRQAQASLTNENTAPGMGSGSLIGLVMAALMAGAASLVAAGRRFSARKASR